MSAIEPDLTVEIEIHDVAEWLLTDLPAWSTRTRFNARLFEREGVVVPSSLGLPKAQHLIPRSPLGGPPA